MHVLVCTTFYMCLCVQIYPSDFGLERMANEEIKGPVELTRDEDDIGDDDETTEVSDTWVNVIQW